MNRYLRLSTVTDDPTSIFSFFPSLLEAENFVLNCCESLCLNIAVMCLVRSVFNPRSRLKFTMKFTFEKRKNTNGERDNDNDDDHVNPHRREAGTPEQAN
ncbi:hypothetical protein P8452_69085 [Trifolium repens]|nr:hypothetical protein P8452_69085 [Trifolium repens]